MRRRWLRSARDLERLLCYDAGPVPSEDAEMPKFVIERELPGISGWSDAERRAAAQQSNKVLRELGPQIQWIQSFVTDDKLYCVYLAPDESTIREHAQRAGFPANRISAVRELIDPTTGD